MKKRIIIGMILITLLAGIAIAFLPLPKHINITLSGAKVTGDLKEDVEIKIKGWYLNYLFRDDTLKGTVSISPYAQEKENQAVYKLFNMLSPADTDVQFCTLVRYSAALNVNVVGTVVFNKNFEIVVIDETEYRDSYYVASKKKLDEVSDIIERFKGFLNR